MILNENYLFMDVLSEAKDLSIKNVKEEVEAKKKDGGITPQFLKTIVTKIYSKKAEDMAEDLPTVGEIARMTITVGIPAAINPLLGVFTYLADRLVSEKVNEKNIGKYVGAYKRQLLAVEKHISTEKDPKKKESYIKLKKDLETALNNLERKYDKLKEYKMSHDKYKKLDESATETEMQQFLAFNESFNEYLKIEEMYDEEILSEGKFRELKSKVTHTVNKNEKRVDDWFDNAVDSVRKAVMNDKREDLIKGTFPALSKLIRRAAMLGVATAINPALGALTLVTTTILRKRLSDNEKAKILRELKQELEIVEEKIKDADSAGDRQKKYELMRLRNKLNTDVDRIKRYI